MTYPTIVDYTFQQWDEANSGVTTTTARDTTGATELRVWTICASVSVPVVTDSKGNTWVEDDTAVVQVTASSYMRCFKATGTVVVGTGHTFTSTLAAANNHIGMIAFRPTAVGNTLAITPLDGVRDLSSPFTSPTISPADDATLIAINGNFPAGAQTITWGDSFTKLLDVSGANRYASSLAYRQVVGGAGPYSASHTSTASLAASAAAIFSVTESGSGTVAPVITSVSDLTPQEGDTLLINSAGGATGFGSTQGTAIIGGASATITAWAAGQIAATVPIGANAFGSGVSVTVTNADTGLTSDPFALTSISPPTGYSYVNVTSINSTPSALLLEALPAIAIGDQIEWESLAGDVVVNADLTASIDPAVTEFDARVWTPGDGWGAWATITINAGANSPPAGTDNSFTLTEDGAAKTFSAADFGYSDPDSDPMQAVRIDTLPAAGALTLSGSAVTQGQVIAVASLGNLVFTPAANGNGAPYASFTFSVQDDQGNFDASPNTITINVTAANDAPTVANAIADQNATEDSAFSFQFAANVFSDVDGDTLTYTAPTLPAWLTFTAGTRTFSGTPAQADVGVHTVVVRATDPSSAYVEDTFTVTVAAVNDGPVAVDDTRSTTVNTPATFDPRTNDTDEEGNALTVTGVTQGTHGAVTFTASSVTYTPDPDYVGPDSFTYTVSDGTTSDTGAVVMSVTEAPTTTVSLSQKQSGVLVPVSLSQRQSGSLVPVAIGVRSGGVLVT